MQYLLTSMLLLASLTWAAGAVYGLKSGVTNPHVGL